MNNVTMADLRSMERHQLADTYRQVTQQIAGRRLRGEPTRALSCAAKSLAAMLDSMPMASVPYRQLAAGRGFNGTVGATRFS